MDGVTTISAFGGSVSASAAQAASAVVEAVAKEPEAQKFKTVIVTRGIEAQSYQVPENGQTGNARTGN